MFAGERKQSLQHAQSDGAALGHQTLGPRATVRAVQTTTFQQIIGAAFDDDALVAVEVRLIGGEATGLGAHMHRDGHEALVVDPHEPRFGAHPHVAANVLRRHGIIRAVIRDVAIAVHLARGFLEAREQRRRQRPQHRLLGLGEKRADLLADRAVNPGVGDGALPVGEKRVLRGETRKRAALERVGLRVFYAGLDLALVPRRHRDARPGYPQKRFSQFRRANKAGRIHHY